MTVSSRQSERVVVWTSALTLPVLFALIPTFLRGRRFTIYYTRRSRLGQPLAWLMRLFWITRPIHVKDVDRYNCPVDDSQSPRLRVQAIVPNQVTATFFERHRDLINSLPYPDARVRRNRVVTNLQKAVAGATRELMESVELARLQLRQEGTTARRLVIVNPSAAVTQIVSLMEIEPDVEFVAPWNHRNSLLAWMVRRIVASVLGLRWRRSRDSSLPNAIATEYWHGLDRTTKLNDFLWWWDSGIAPERVVAYFDRSDRPAMGQVVARLQSIGFRCVATNSRGVGDLPHLRWRATPGFALSMARLRSYLPVYAWALWKGPEGRWLACRTLEMLQQSQQWEDFLTDFNIRAIFHYSEGTMDGLSLACDATGAARIGYHWSHYPWPEACVAALHQVYFAWGSHTREILGLADSCTDHMLISGCTIHRAHNGSAAESPSHRQLVTEHGADRVLALFDDSRPCEAFFRFFLERVLDDPRWGMLIKPKGDLDLPWVKHAVPELEALVTRAIATGRVHILDWQMSPAEAAAAADFAVAVDISSAAVVAALAGHRAIHLDYLRLHESPVAPWALFHSAGPDRLVFDDPEKLWDALNSFFDTPGACDDLGLADDRLLRDIDPFRDGQAGRRMGDYLRWYLEGLDHGLARDQALEEADELYMVKWGTDMVVSATNHEGAPAY